MHLDILIFAIIAAFLIYRLNAALGTRHGAERERPNPFAQPEPAAKESLSPVLKAPEQIRAQTPLAGIETLVDASANKDGRIETGLSEIAAADAQFDVQGFMSGARGAFEMIVTAYSRGETETLRGLLSPNLFQGFDAGIRARMAAGHAVETKIHRISKAQIIEAHLGGTMAYITVDFDVEETTVTRDSAGNIVEGSPERVFSVEDIWTFTRDTRSADPNWILIETRAVEK